MRMYNQCGWVDVDDGAARETVQNHPSEWSLHPWTRPSGTPNVNIPDNWQSQSADRRIEFARLIKNGGTNGETPAALGITDPSIADETIRNYIAGSKRPEVKP